MSIGAVSSITSAVARSDFGGSSSASAVGTASSGDFSTKLLDAIGSVSDLQGQADASVSSVAAGTDANLHDMMISLQEADIALRAMVSVRDKVVEGYQQVMNMSI